MIPQPPSGVRSENVLLHQPGACFSFAQRSSGELLGRLKCGFPNCFKNNSSWKIKNIRIIVWAIDVYKLTFTLSTWHDTGVSHTNSSRGSFLDRSEMLMRPILQNGTRMCSLKRERHPNIQRIPTWQKSKIDIPTWTRRPGQNSKYATNTNRKYIKHPGTNIHKQIQ